MNSALIGLLFSGVLDGARITSVSVEDVSADSDGSMLSFSVYIESDDCDATGDELADNTDSLTEE